MSTLLTLRESYWNNHEFVDFKVAVPRLAELVNDRTVIGASRFTIMPSFSPEAVYTFVYRENAVFVSAALGNESLWDSLGASTWPPPTFRRWKVPVSILPKPLGSWRLLTHSAIAAPTVESAIIDGEELRYLDGISFRHRVCDRTNDIRADWRNPKRQATNHVEQVRLIRVYARLLLRLAIRYPIKCLGPAMMAWGNLD